VIDLHRLRGIRLTVLWQLAWEASSRRRARSAVAIVVVALAVAVVVGTTGRTDARRRSLLARLEDPAARLIRVVDRGGQASLTPDTLETIRSVGSVSWALGLSPAGPLGRNPSSGDPRRGYAREAVGTRLYWGPLLGGPLIHLTAGREAAAGEAIAGDRAADTLGLADRLGTVDDESRGAVAVVGSASAISPVENLEAYVFIRGDEEEGPITEVLILVRSASEVEPLVERLPSLLPAGGESVGVDRAAALLGIREELAADLDGLNAAILFGSVAFCALMTAAILYGAVEARRREFGIRRAQGASRSTIASLVIFEAFLLSSVGALAGGIAGAVVVVLQTGVVPDPLLAAAVGTIVCLSAVAGSIAPALGAALRQPLYVLRVE